jgi:hypothetical protein
LLEKGVIDPTDLIGEVHPLNDGIQALEEASRAGVLKVLLRMQ